MSTAQQTKVVVLLSEDEHSTLKSIVRETRRTLGQEIAFRAFSAIKPPARKTNRKGATV